MTHNFATNPDLNLAYIAWNYSEGQAPNSEAERSVLIREFQEWLTEYTRQQREEAWARGYADGQDSVYTSVNEWPNPDIKNPYGSES